MCDLRTKIRTIFYFQRIRKISARPISVIVSVFSTSYVFCRSITNVIITLKGTMLRRFPGHGHRVLIKGLLPRKTMNVKQRLKYLCKGGTIRASTLLVRLIRCNRYRVRFRCARRKRICVIIVPRRISFIYPCNCAGNNFLTVRRAIGPIFGFERLLHPSSNDCADRWNGCNSRVYFRGFGFFGERFTHGSAAFDDGLLG